MPDNFDEHRRRRELESSLIQTRDRSHTADVAQRKRNDARTIREAQEQEYPEFAQAGLRRISGYFFLILAIPAALFIDFIVLNRPVEYLAGLVFPENSWQILLAKIMTPIAIVGLELYIATQLYFAQAGEASRHWKKAAHFMLLLMPAMVVITFVPQHLKVLSTSLGWIYALLLLALTILSGITHGLIIYGGETAYEARAFFWFQLTRDRYRRIERKQDAIYRRQAERGFAVLTNYINGLNIFNRRYPDRPIEPGPFDDITYRIMNQWAGYDIIQRPLGNPDNNQPPQLPSTAPNAPPTNPAAPNAVAEPEEDGENEYLRNILTNRIRTDESEVRP